MAEQLIGLATSVAAYFAGVWLFLRVQSRQIRALPPEWRGHPDLRERYDAALQHRVRSVVTSPNRAGLGWLAVFVVAFVLLTVAEFTLGFQLIYIAALALWWTLAERQSNLAETERLRERDGLPATSGQRGARRRRSVALVARFAVWTGFLGTACFLGGLLAAPFG